MTTNNTTTNNTKDDRPFVPAYTARAITLPSRSRMDIYRPKPLPGIIILVHGVNSDGEWYEATEAGLCQGLNARLKREDQHCHVVQGSGQLIPNTYPSELTDDGFIRDDLKTSNPVEPGGYSPVIRFRWGYKAGTEDIAAIGGNIFLNEDDAWGGGPFINGCSALPDMWDRGAATSLFASLLAVQDFNAGSRLVYDAPLRHYQALAAYRLAKLVAEVRRRHRLHNGFDCPVTVICHSQGTMVGLGSAFYGKHMFNGDGVASTYLLANSPCSLLPNLFDNISQFSVFDPRGRVTVPARQEMLKRFFEIVRSARHRYPSDASVTPYVGNTNPKDGSPPWCCVEDRQKHGTGLSVDGHHGRVFVYSNPHDRVVSVSPIQGIGWLGLSAQQAMDTRAKGVLFQRVWAQATVRERPFEVGKDYGPRFEYDAWDHTLRGENGRFWYRKPDRMLLQVADVLTDPRRSALGKSASVWAGIHFQIMLETVGLFSTEGPPDMQATPPMPWRVPLNALPVPRPIVPRALHLYHPQPSADDDQQSGTHGKVTGMFNQGPEHERDALNPQRVRDEHDPYYTAQGVGQGNRDTEAALRYEHHAQVRQRARRVIYDDDGKVQPDAPFSEDDVKQLRGDGRVDADSAFGQFDHALRQHFVDAGREQRTAFLNSEHPSWLDFMIDDRKQWTEAINRALDQPATNHSTILTNPEHSERVVAYDVDVGACHLLPQEMDFLRRMADWRRCKGIAKKGEDMGSEWEYYEWSTIKAQKLSDIPAYSHTASSAAGQSVLDQLKIPHERFTLPDMSAGGYGGVAERQWYPDGPPKR